MKKEKLSLFEKVMEKIYIRVFEECWWVFNHDWVNSSKTPRVPSGESWYWRIQVCGKCGKERMIFNDYNL